MSVSPIGISIPETKIIDFVPEKQKRFAHIIPGQPSTYIFSDETSYYKDYQSSIFGRTSKKGGWDCMRHYEILANGCIPWFTDLENCPPGTMTHFPKDIVIDAMNSETPELYIPKLLDYTRKNLTCRAMAQSIFDKVGCPNPTRVLFLGNDSTPDYIRCLTLIGMKQILGNRCVDSVHIPHIYEDYPSSSNLYGKGFTYSRVLPVSSKSAPVHISEVRDGLFDIIVYGSIHRGMPYWEEVKKVYPKEKIVLLCGEDCDEPNFSHHDSCLGYKFAKEGYNVFIRELESPIVVQIGTNNGNDHVLDLCKKRYTSAIYLVEPFSIHNNSIQANYKDIPNVIIENIAITPTAQDSIELFYTEDDGPQNNVHKSYQVASIKQEHIVKHDYSPSNIKSINVPAMTINDFFAKHNLTTINYLFLDIEGIDFEVLKSIDFSKVNIKNLQIEHLHLDKETLISYMKERGYSATVGLDVHGFDTMFVKQYPNN